MTVNTAKNYTNEQVEVLVAAYAAATDEGERDAVVVDFAEKFEKTKASVRAKLVREGVYVAKTKASVGKRVPKNDLVSKLANVLGVDEDVVGSLEKATAVALTKVLEAVRKLKAQ